MDQDGNKVRDTNLNKTFNLGIGKEELLSRFERNAASMERDKYSHDKCLGIAARIRITEFTVTKKEVEAELKERVSLAKKIQPALDEIGKDIKGATRSLKKLKEELKGCSKLQFVKRHDLKEKIAHKEAFIESSKKTRQSLLNSNDFGSEKDFDKYTELNSKMESLSEQLRDVILKEQTDFDLIYDRIDATKDVAEVVLDPRDIEELKASLRKVFSKDFSDADIEKAEKQFNDYDNGNRSTHRMLNKHKREIEKAAVQNRKREVNLEKIVNVVVMDLFYKDKVCKK